MSQKRKQPDDGYPAASGEEPTVFRSDPIVDRDSTFVGLYSPSLQPKEVQRLGEIKAASHKILGWRRESNQQSLTSAKQYVTGHDDDGEKYGGKKVEQVLINMGVTGVCVVARWYGGTMLGPVRFTHMEMSAKEAVQKWREHTNEARAKKRKVEEDGAEKDRLVKALAARDASINVLRALAVEKESKAKEASEPAPSSSQETVAVVQQATIVDATAGKSPSNKEAGPSPPAIDYSPMTLDRLKSLDKARDATLSFLLKRIDKAEAVTVKSEQTQADSDRPP